MDLGLSKLLTPALEWLCDVIGQYGLAIIVATVLLRLLILPLDIMQRKSSLRMQALNPKVEEINQRFASDPQKRMQAVQQLYKKEGVSNMSGCLPLLIQLPFFAGFFTAMRNIGYQTTLQFYELVKAGDMAGFTALLDRCRFLWIGNVFQADAMFTVSLGSLFGGGSSIVSIIPTAEEAAIAFAQLGVEISDYAAVMGDVIAQFNTRTNGLFIIAILAGVASYFQQKSMPQTAASADPQQAGTMKGMMIFMTIFSVYLCATYNAAFGLYWMVTVAMGMILQLILRKVYTPERLARKKGVADDGTVTEFPDRKKKRSAQKEDVK